MARLASEAKGGYYATPPEEMALVLKRLTVNKDTVLRIADFCCGDGAVLKQTADHFKSKGANVVTYGVEIEEGRAKEAKKNLDFVVNDNYEDIVMTNGVIGFSWLNPPYTYISRQDGKSERFEVAFLRNLTRPGGYLRNGAVIGFCVPKSVIFDAASIISNRLSQIKVYRFTDKNYDRFNQVVLLGYLRRQTSNEKRLKTQKYLEYIGRDCNYQNIPPLDQEDHIKYFVPTPTKEVKNFYGKYIDPLEAAEEVENSINWQTIENYLLPPIERGKHILKRPLLPFNSGQMALAISAGVIDGQMGTFIFKGGSEKVTTETQERTKTGTKYISTERIVTFTRIFSNDGVEKLA